jgi:hypothetical protein
MRILLRSPIFQVRINGFIRNININRILEDMVLAFENYDNNFVLFLDKKSLYEGRIIISSKRIK